MPSIWTSIAHIEFGGESIARVARTACHGIGKAEAGKQPVGTMRKSANFLFFQSISPIEYCNLLSAKTAGAIACTD